ncbi:MAG: M56 family metallopeptidase [Planctomycetota bacterium]
MSLDALVPGALAWVAVCGLGALGVGAAAYAFDVAASRRAPAVASALWIATLVRLVLPPSIGSPFGLEPAPSALHPAFSAADAAPVTRVLLVLWAAVAFALLVRFAVRVERDRRRFAARVHGRPRRSTLRLAERCARAAGLRRVPRVLVAPSGPATIGLVRPFVGIPRELERADRRDELEAVLLHEFAHVARRDGWRRSAIALVQCVLWFHPCAWIAGRRLAALAEIDCDRRAAAVARGGSDACRTALLSQVARWLDRDTPLAQAFAHPGSVVLARLRALERPARHGRVAAALAFSVALACIGPHVERALSIPPVDELDGCLRKRFAVMAYAASHAPGGAAHGVDE